MSYIVAHTKFIGLSKAGSGACIYSENKDFNFFCCFFLNNWCTYEGGCIYFKNGILFIIKTIFKQCYSTANTNDIRGNAVCLNEKELHLNNSLVYLCAPSASKQTDSSIHAHQAKSIVFEYNATSNYGIAGGAGISLYPALSGTFIKNSLLVDGHDNYMVENTLFFTVNNTNFVNCSDSRQAVCYNSGNNQYVFDSCVFWNIGNIPITYNNYIYKAINCFSNSQKTSISLTQGLVAIKLKRVMCLVETNNIRIKRKFGTFFFIFQYCIFLPYI